MQGKFFLLYYERMISMNPIQMAANFDDITKTDKLTAAQQAGKISAEAQTEEEQAQQNTDRLELSEKAQEYLNSENKGGQSAGMSLETSQNAQMPKGAPPAGKPQETQTEKSEDGIKVSDFLSDEEDEVSDDLSEYTETELKELLNNNDITQEEYDEEIASRE